MPRKLFVWPTIIQFTLFLKNVHANSRRLKMFMCSVCGMQISDKSNYNKHVQSHSDELGYKCTVCSKGQKQKNHAERCQVLADAP